ncbi:MAG: hypothetical protein IT311_03390 [Anaerolineales bacterium]|nr:hypothetical protein [Anaerolineales bacterium]MCZ2121319.1 hypothetical protein [Anaerolineales bacterium]
MMLTLPSIVLGLVCALLLGAVYHVVRGGGGWRLLLFLGVSILGFAGGQALSVWLGWRLWMAGALDLGMGSIGSLLFLAVGEWLSRIEVKNESGL